MRVSVSRLQNQNLSRANVSAHIWQLEETMPQDTACHKSCLIPLLGSLQGTVGGPALQREPSPLLSLCIWDVHFTHKCHCEHTQKNVCPKAWLPWLGQTDMCHSPSQCNIQGKGDLPFRGLQLQFWNCFVLFLTHLFIQEILPERLPARHCIESCSTVT